MPVANDVDRGEAAYQYGVRDRQAVAAPRDRLGAQDDGEARPRPARAWRLSPDAAQPVEGAAGLGPAAAVAFGRVAGTARNPRDSYTATGAPPPRCRRTEKSSVPGAAASKGAGRAARTSARQAALSNRNEKARRCPAEISNCLTSAGAPWAGPSHKYIFAA